METPKIEVNFDQDALHDLISKWVLEDDPAIREAVQKLLGEALEEFLHGSSDDKKRGFDQKMGEAFSYVFTKGPYD